MANGITDRRFKSVLDAVRRDQPDLWQPWFAGLQSAGLKNGLLQVRADDDEHAYYLDSSCRRAFADAARAELGRLVSVEFLGPDGRSAESALASGGNHSADSNSPASPGIAMPGHSAGTVPGVNGGNGLGGTYAIDEPVRLNPGYTFDNFITGPGNRLPHAAAVAVADTPGVSYNPLFIHGSVGLGKTHLLQAICHGILAKRPDARICYLSCESFINHFITAVEQGALNDFRFRYRHVDVLVIDDIHFLAERERTQDEFFHTFNTLYQAQKQIVLSSDSTPAEIPDLEERLVSRFNWGLVARIDPPTYETRVAIVRRKARLREVDLPEDVACYIAARVESNIREIEGALTKVTVTAQVQGGPVTIELARAALGEPPPGPASREISIQEIMDAVMDRYQVRLADLQSKKRSRSIAFPRQICMYLARQLTRHSLGEIGGYFGGRDHTTVLHATRSIEHACKLDAQLETTLKQIGESIQAGNFSKR